jgi:hypothetical protein
MTYESELGTDAFGNITRINNTLADLPKKLSGAKSQLDNLYQQQESAKLELEKPFELADELADKEARLALINADLNIDGNGGFDVTNDDENRDEFTERVGDALDEMGVKYSRGYDPDDAYDDGDPDSRTSGVYQHQAASAKSVKPSLLEGLRSFSPDRQMPGSGKKQSEIDI